MLIRSSFSALARSAVYDFLSLAFLYPKATKSIGLTDHPLIRSSHPLTDSGPSLEDEVAGAFAALRSVLKSLSLTELEAQYVRVLGHTLSPECPPYETEYVGSHDEADIFPKTQKLADIVGFYRAWGLEVSEQAKERPDHIAIELEFMSYLTRKEAYAHLKGLGNEKIKLCQQAQKKFLMEHLGRWALPFTRLLERRSLDAGAAYYEKLARLTRAWLTREFAILNVSPLAPMDFKPSRREEAGCDSCPLASF